MTRIVDVFFEVSISVVYRVVKMTLKVTNNSPNDYYINSGVVMYNSDYGCLPFGIRGPSEIDCYSDSSRNPEGIALELRSQMTVTNEVILSEICNFQQAKPGLYHVRYNTYFYLYHDMNTTGHAEDFAYMVSNASFKIEDVEKGLSLVGESASDKDL